MKAGTTTPPATSMRTLRRDEEFVASAISAHFNGKWTPGNDPPDVCLQLPDREVFLEISTLGQLVLDEMKGGRKPRRSEDATAFWLANELDKNLRKNMPNDRIVILSLSSPIKNARKTEAALRKSIATHITLASGKTDATEIVEGNRIKLAVRVSDGSDCRKILAVVLNSKSDPDILRNAWCTLEDRIRIKAKKCKEIRSDIWLGLFNDYFLADTDTYRQAFGCFHVEHPFSRILIVSGDGAVDVL